MKALEVLLTEIRDLLAEIAAGIKALGAANPAQDRTGVLVDDVPHDDSGESQEPDTLAVVRAFEAVEGLHEIKDKTKIMELFAKHGIKDWQGEVFDPVKDAWCGAGLRYLICEAGFADPGINCHKASNYESYGEEVEPASDDPFDVPPGTILVYNSHCSVLDEDGNECGGNVRNSYFRSKVSEKWFGVPFAWRKPVV